MRRSGPRFLTTAASASVLALQLVTGADGKVRPGLLKQVAFTADFAMCGDGFNNQTVKVRLGGEYYFVFREHVEGWLRKTSRAVLP